MADSTGNTLRLARSTNAGVLPAPGALNRAPLLSDYKPVQFYALVDFIRDESPSQVPAASTRRHGRSINLQAETAPMIGRTLSIALTQGNADHRQGSKTQTVISKTQSTCKRRSNPSLLLARDILFRRIKYIALTTSKRDESRSTRGAASEQTILDKICPEARTGRPKRSSAMSGPKGASRSVGIGDPE
jgi:hypothetical protein